MLNVKRGNMWAGEFRDLLRRLNPRLIVFRGDKGRERFAMIRYWMPEFNPDEGNHDYRCDGNWQSVCPAPVNWVPERTILDATGVPWKRGWREIIKIIEGKGIPLSIPNWLGLEGKRGKERYGYMQQIRSDGSLIPIKSARGE